MPQLAFKRPVPLIVAGLAGLLIGLLAYPLLLNQVRTRVIDEQFAHLSDATAAATRMTATVHQALSALASELDLPASPPGCSKELQDRLQAFQLRTPSAEAAFRIEDNRLTCASLPSLGDNTLLPAHHSQRSDGTRLWYRLQLQQAPQGGPYTLLERQQLGVMLDPDEQFSRFFGGDVRVAVYENSPPFPTSLTVGQIPAPWLQRLPPGSREQRLQDQQSGDLLVRRLSTSGQTVILASRSAASLQAQIANGSHYLWSQALLIGLAGAILTLLVYPRQSSSRRVLERALHSGQMFLLYQPVVDLQSGQCIGAEALMRWRQQDGSTLGPDVFIPLAEQLQLSDRISDCACQIIARELPALLQRMPDFHISVNVSAQELNTFAIVQRLVELRQRLRLQPSQLIAELTESSLAEAERALPVIRQLRANGISVAIDDFGTGYCSLSYLATYPFDILKIDKSFVSAAGTDSIIGPIAEHIVTLSKSLGVAALAEGIETPEQAENFRRQGVALAQGYYFGAPMPMAQLLERVQGPAQS